MKKLFSGTLTILRGTQVDLPHTRSPASGRTTGLSMRQGARAVRNAEGRPRRIRIIVPVTTSYPPWRMVLARVR